MQKLKDFIFGSFEAFACIAVFKNVDTSTVTDFHRMNNNNSNNNTHTHTSMCDRLKIASKSRIIPYALPFATFTILSFTFLYYPSKYRNVFWRNQQRIDKSNLIKVSHLNIMIWSIWKSVRRHWENLSIV